MVDSHRQYSHVITMTHLDVVLSYLSMVLIFLRMNFFLTLLHRVVHLFLNGCRKIRSKRIKRAVSGILNTAL